MSLSKRLEKLEESSEQNDNRVMFLISSRVGDEPIIGAEFDDGRVYIQRDDEADYEFEDRVFEAEGSTCLIGGAIYADELDEFGNYLGTSISTDISTDNKD